MEIKSINSYTKPNGKVNVVINDGAAFIGAAMLEQACGIKRNYNVLVGSNVDVTFFAVDETIAEDVICTTADKIVKSIAVTLSPRLQAIADAAAFN